MSPLRPLRRAAAAVLAAASGLAAGPVDFRHLARPAIRSYAQRDGLPHHTVQQLVLDGKGRIWAATQGGAAVFDGRRWTPVVPPAELGGAYIRTLLEWRGAMWMGTQDSGVFCLQAEGWTHTDTAQGLPDDRVNHLARVPREGGGEELWAATAEGPARWAEGRWIPEVQGLESKWTWRLVPLPEGAGHTELWACTRGGLAKWDGRAWRMRPEFRGAEVNDLADDAERPGKVRWVSSFGRGLARWSGDGISYPAKEAGLPLTHPSSLAWTRDVQGRPVLWAGTYSDGLACLRGGRWTLFTTDRGLRSPGVYALLPDPRGKPALWIGMQGGGVASLTTEGWWSLQSRQTGLPSPDVTCLAESAEPEGPRLWFGTPKGLSWFDGAAWHSEGRGPALALAKAWEGPAPTLAAAMEGGVALRRGGRWVHLGSAPPGEARALLGPRSGGLWAATDQGLFRWQGGAWEPDALQADQAGDVLCLEETLDAAGRGTLWAGTRGHGLWRRREGRWERLDPMPRYPRNWITSLRAAPGPDGRTRLWVGTRGQGLASLDPEAATPAFQVYDGRSPVPLPNTVVYAIEQGRDGRLYLGASGGLERLSFRPDGHTLQRVETFGPADGLLTAIANPGASLVDSRGQVWFGLPEGPAFLDPTEVLPSHPLPAPVLERLQVEGRETGLEPGLHYPYTTHRFSFDFFIPVYFREEDLRFRTQLVGMEPEPGPWRQANVRDFGGLGPGTYDFVVWARNHEGHVSPPMHFPFTIRHSPWTHPLAWAVYAALAAGGVLLVVHLRTRLLMRRNQWLQVRVDSATEELRSNHLSLQVLTEHLTRLNEEKSVFMSMAAHDLRNPLHGIRLRAEMLGFQDDEPPEEVSREICGAVDEVLRMLNRLLDVEALEAGLQLQLRPVPAADLVREACGSHHVRAEAKRIALVQELPDPALRVMADPDTLQQVLDNLLSNALKFSEPGRRVWVGAAAREGRGALWVRDEGPGFRPEDQARAFQRFAKLSARPTAGETSTGLGLAIVKRLVEEMGGRIELESQPGAGATFTVLLPLGKDGG